MAARLFGSPWDVSLPSSLSDPLLARLVAGGRRYAQYDPLAVNLMTYLIFAKYGLKGSLVSMRNMEIKVALAALDKLAKAELASRLAEQRYLTIIDELFAAMVAKVNRQHSKSEEQKLDSALAERAS